MSPPAHTSASVDAATTAAAASTAAHHKPLSYFMLMCASVAGCESSRTGGCHCVRPQEAESRRTKFYLLLKCGGNRNPMALPAPAAKRATPGRDSPSAPFAPSPLRPQPQRAALSSRSGDDAPVVSVWWRYRDPASGAFYFALNGGAVTWTEPTEPWLDADEVAARLAATVATVSPTIEPSGCVLAPGAVAAMGYWRAQVACPAGVVLCCPVPGWSPRPAPPRPTQAAWPH